MSEVRSVIVQVRDVPEDVVDTLKARAEARGQSLSAYLRDLLTEEVGKPAIEAVMERIASRKPFNYEPDALREFREDGRR